jgi:hypothetical protein
MQQIWRVCQSIREYIISSGGHRCVADKKQQHRKGEKACVRHFLPHAISNAGAELITFNLANQGIIPRRGDNMLALPVSRQDSPAGVAGLQKLRDFWQTLTHL